MAGGSWSQLSIRGNVREQWGMMEVRENKRLVKFQKRSVDESGARICSGNEFISS